MRRRNEVPFLQQLAARKVSWPDGINRRDTEGYPSIEQYCRETIYQNFFKQDKSFALKTRTETSSLVIDNWIHLSSYYGISFGDLTHLTCFLKSHPPISLDFLRQGFILTDESEKTKINRAIGKIPYAVLPRGINPKVWQDIVTCLTKIEVIKFLTELQLQFQVTPPTISKAKRKTLRFKPKEKEEIKYDFASTFKDFKNLTKLVIKGLNDDSILTCIGSTCETLKHLDISENKFTADGIRLLFYSTKEAEKLYRLTHKTFGREFPKNLLRPLTKTLEYFDMDEVPRYTASFDYKTGILIACPQLVKTPHNFYYTPNGDIRMMCRGYLKSPTLLNLRQQLVLHVRTQFCHDIFCFIRGLLACIPSGDPGFQVRVDKEGNEVGFLFFAHQYVIAHCELQNLTIINFTSYSSSSCEFVSIELLSHFAPKLQWIKAPLSGCVSRMYPLPFVRFITCPMIRTVDTLRSIIRKCKSLKYLEVREILLHISHLDDEDIKDIFEHEIEKLEVLRLLFFNKISLVKGMTHIITKCPALRIIGDVKMWGIVENTFLSFTLQLRYHNFRISVEYGGVIHYSDSYGGEILRWI